MKAIRVEDFEEYCREKRKRELMDSNKVQMDYWTIAIYNSEEPAREIAFGYYEDFGEMLQDFQVIRETAEKEEANYTIFDFAVTIPVFVEVSI